MTQPRVFTAPTLREVIAKAKEAFGENFMVYKKKNVIGGVELTAGPELSSAPVASPVEEQVQTGFRRALARSEQSVLEFEIPTLPIAKQQGPATAYRKTRGNAAYATQASERIEPANKSEPAAPKVTTDGVRMPSPEQVMEVFEAEPVEDEIPQVAQLDANQKFQEDLKQLEAVAGWSSHLLGDVQKLQEVIRRRLLPSVEQGSAYADMHNLLIQAGFKPASCDAVLKHVPGEIAERRLDPLGMSRWVEQALSSHLQVMKSEDIWSEGRVVIPLLGSSGCGKSVALAKLAARFSLRHHVSEIQIISLDPDNADLLRAHADVLGVSFKVLQEFQDLGEELKRFATKKVVLIDTQGYGYRSKKLPVQLARLNLPDQPIKPLLVMNANSESDLLDLTTRTYVKLGRDAGVNIDNCLVSKLDDTVRIGGLLSAIEQHGLTVCYQSYSSDIFDDFERGSSMTLSKQAFESAALGWATTISGPSLQQGQQYDQFRDQLMNNVHEMSQLMSTIKREFKSVGMVTRQAEASGLLESGNEPKFGLQLANPTQAPPKAGLLWFRNDYQVDSVFYKRTAAQNNGGAGDLLPSDGIEIVG